VREARNALLQIPQPDAHVALQRGLLALSDNQPAQAEQDFAQALAFDPACYEAAYNLLLTRLTLGQTEAAAELLAQLQTRAPFVDDHRLFRLLHQLLLVAQPDNDAAPAAP